MIPIFRSADRSRFFARLEKRKSLISGPVRSKVRRILSEVRSEGDRALLRWTRELDQVKMTAAGLRVQPKELRAAAAKADPAVVLELEKAIFNIRAYHSRQLQNSWDFTRRGVTLGQRVTPLGSVGLYVPGGSAAYPSSVLMNVVPAKIAGVPRIVVVTPPGTFQRHPVIAAALRLLQVQEIYRVGGAQAIAALAYGTQSIRRVDKIVGPGNLYVTAAKKEVFGEVDIDMIAGPSEVVVLCSAGDNPRFIAADMLSQAEHDPAASAICFTDSAPHAVLVGQEIEKQLNGLPRKSIAKKSLQDYGALVVLDSYMDAAEWINELAPEHLEIFSSIPKSAIDRVPCAGAIFYGDYSPEAVGDYFAGSNHVLPTGGTARFFSPLGVYDFVRKTSIIHYSREELARTWRSIEKLALSEGLDAHARSVAIRQEDSGRRSDEGEDLP